MTKKYFEPVNSQVNFVELEKNHLVRWYEKGVVKKYLEKNNKSPKVFSFLDGPITANNPMGVHHAWGRTYKDLWQRFYNMQGYRQRFQNGFDCQGLWVEVEVEKELGFKTKKDIENYGVDNFVEKCKERVLKYANIQTEQSKRLGYFMDWENSYFTMADENNYMIWHFLKVCNEKGWIYKGQDSVPWCPRCETAISQHEMLTEDYKELTHETVFFKLPVENENFSLLAWTTTPWTIPANVALAINPNFKYTVWDTGSGEKIVTLNPSHIEDPEQKNWFEKNVLSSEWKKLKDIKGSSLVGLRYTGPFDNLDRVKKAQSSSPETFHTVVEAEDLVVSSKGTGILHVAPGAGEEDFKLGKEKSLPIITVIEDDARYLEGMGEFSAQNAKKHPEIIIDYLKAKDNGKYLYKTLRYTHRYPACWRCKTELVWKIADEWYIAMDKKDKDGLTLREKMINVAKKIKWNPEFGLDRELDWLKNMHDWLISKKNRYWGLALPIYECKKCSNFQVIGGKEELKSSSISGWSSFEGHSPHRPWIDEVKIKCNSCGQSVERIKDVGNPWLDAGIVPFSTITEENKGMPLYFKNKKEWETWFPADFITESFPGQFKNWFYALIAMSTVLENKNPYKSVLGFATLLAEDGRPMHKSWGNSIEFNEGADKIGVDVMRWMYVRQNPTDNMLFGYNIANETRRRFHLKLWNIYNFFVTYANLDDWKPSNKKPAIKTKLDEWVLMRLAESLEKATKALKDYNVNLASIEIEKFVDDLSLWYIRRSRDRVGPVTTDENSRVSFYETCFTVLEILSRLLAPFTPFISEEIYSNLTKDFSVHLSSWPKLDISIDKHLISSMNLAREIVEKAHSSRKLAQIPVRQPLSLLTVGAPSEAPDQQIIELIKEELNIKEVKWIKATDLNIELNTLITPELEEEAKARELIRTIQDKRKEMKLSLTERIIVTAPWVPKSEDIQKRVQEKTLANSLSLGEFEVEAVTK